MSNVKYKAGEAKLLLWIMSRVNTGDGVADDEGAGEGARRGSVVPA